MKMEIAFPTKQRCLPITCHNIVLFHLLKHIPRVLAELCEEYRISLFDRSCRFREIFSHHCGEHPSFHCALKFIEVNCKHLRGNSGRVQISFGGDRKEAVFFDLKHREIPNKQAMMEVATMGRSAQDVLADMLREGVRTSSFSDVMEKTHLCRGSVVSKHFGQLFWSSDVY